MITNSRKTQKNTSDKTRAMYYVLMDDGEPFGVSTSMANALVCIKDKVEERSAVKVPDKDLYYYEDSSGCHTISIRIVKKARPVRDAE